MSEFEPKIVGFFCNWCTSAAADLAGTSRMKYPHNVLPIRVPCSGTVDPVYIIRALREGADGVLIGGCHLGDCHYVNGNLKARRRVKLVKVILENLKMEPERVQLAWISASEGKKFKEVVTKFTEMLKEMGPSKLSLKWK